MITIEELIAGSWVWRLECGTASVAINVWLWRHPEYAAAIRAGAVGGRYRLVEGGHIHEYQLYNIDRRDDPRQTIRWTGEGFEHV